MIGEPDLLRPCHQLTAVNIRSVPKAIRDQFKAYCARRGYTMQRAAIALMRKAIMDNMALPEARKNG
jgi:hypothetical protein